MLIGLSLHHQIATKVAGGISQAVALWDTTMNALTLCLQPMSFIPGRIPGMTLRQQWEQHLMDRVRDGVADELPTHCQPDRIVCVGEFPITRHGK